MGRLRFASLAAIIAISLVLFLPACGGAKKPGAGSPFPAKINLVPGVSYSIQLGSVVQLSASAQNGSNSNISPGFTFVSSNPGILDVAPNGGACAGTWNAPLYSVCTPAATGIASVTAQAFGASSPPTLFFVHSPIDDIQISVVTPANAQPPACPSQIALPAACNLQFNNNAGKFCLSQNQVQTLQASAFSKGADITATIGPFSWNEVSGTVAKFTPIVDPSQTVATNQISVSPNTPGQTQVIASASGFSSQPYYFETCPVQCIDLAVGANGTQQSGDTTFSVPKSTSETITATVVDVQGCIVPKPTLTWASSSPAAISVGSACTGAVCNVTTPQPGSAAISASCTPPSCNVGFPLNPAANPAPYAPQPVYPITAVSGLVTGSSVATSVLVTSRDCATDVLCSVAFYNVSSSSNLPGGAYQLPTPPNSLMFDLAGDKAYAGSQFGALAITTANLTGTSSPFTFLGAPGTPLGLVIGKVIGVSENGTQAVFSDTVSTPNQVYVVNSSPTSTTALNIDSATSAAFSPDGLKAFILGNGGNTLNVYSTLQALQSPVALPTPATAVVFSSTGSFALLAGGGTAGNLAAYNTCDNSALSPTLPSGTLPAPPLFLRMVPAGNLATGTAFIPPLQPAGLDLFFGVDNTGIDVIATTSSLVPLPLPTGPLTPPNGCTRPIVLAQTLTNTTFEPVHINIGQGTFQPINFFVSPDATQVYIVTSDLGVLVYNFNSRGTSKISLINNATPLAADITADGTLIYVAGSDGLLHVLNTTLGIDEQPPISFSPLSNSANSFCYTGANCAPDLVAVKP
jgi:hypothetical protein